MISKRHFAFHLRKRPYNNMPSYKLYASNEEEFVELPVEALRHCGAIWSYIEACPESDGAWTLGANLPPKVEPKLEDNPDKPDQDVDKMELEQFQRQQAQKKKEEQESPAPGRTPSYPIDKKHLDFIVEFLYRHKDDEEPMSPEDLRKFRELDDWEKEKLEPFQALRGIALQFAAKFLGHFRLLQITSRNIARQLETRNEEEIQQYYGIPAKFTKEQEKATRARFPEFFA